MYLVTYNMPGDKRRPTLFADMKAVEDYMNKIAENNPNQNMAWMNVQKIVKFSIRNRRPTAGITNASSTRRSKANPSNSKPKTDRRETKKTRDIIKRLKQTT